MRLNAVKRSAAVLVSGAALFLTLGAGCENGGGGDGDDNPGVENTQDNDGDNGGDNEQDGEQGEDQEGDEGN